MMKYDLPHAVERAAHQIAANVHMMLWETNTTVDELKAKLEQFPSPRTVPEVVDNILAAKNSDRCDAKHLADIAFALGCEWDFKVVRIPDEPQACVESENAAT